jgi:hypothetical protein
MRALTCAVLVLFLGIAHAETPDAGDPVEKAAAKSSLTTECVCINGPLAEEIAKLRTEIRLLKAAKLVNEGIECRKNKKRELKNSAKE